ncbi:MAG TPA: universal stress protein [Chloroflexi bacterium]|nr:MAG: hypothetical protein B6243_04415 [Anaerolineaceae bacterium 4572_5.2]HEY83568.1 universal stress protein [Chloroflexota bacterium]
MINRILLPLDGSEFAEKVLPFALELGAKLNAEIKLLWVLHPLIVMSDYSDTSYRELVAQEEIEAKKYLGAQCEDLEKAGLTVNITLLEGRVADAIVDMACQEDVDLIMMSTHGRSGPKRWIHGSVATKVLQQAPCPVFLVGKQSDECQEA